MTLAAGWKSGLALTALLASVISLTYGQFQWFEKDKFDEIWRKIHLANAQSCVTARPSELILPLDVVTQIPNVKDAEDRELRRNRTGTMHVYNTAINRAFFWSYILQRMYDDFEPGLQYYYLSTSADVMANKVVNASTIVFDNKCSYPNFYYNFFNKTIDLFAPSCFRDDNDYEDSTNWLGVPTMKTVSCDDLGAGVQSNYTNAFYRPKMNPWYEKWMPDRTKDGTKAVYTITLTKTDNKTGKWLQEEKFSVYGPPAPEDNPGPVKWTAPYFDCGGSNKWVVSAVSPIVDLYPRHAWAFIDGKRIEWRHVQYQKYVALAIMNVDLIMIDINQCPRDQIHEDANFFAGTAKCKPTTMCEPIPGFGFQRGGYKCVCKPGFRYPFWQKGAFLGTVIERATNEEFERNFDCLEVRDKYVIPDQSSGSLNPEVNRGEWSVGRKKRSLDVLDDVIVETEDDGEKETEKKSEREEETEETEKRSETPTTESGDSTRKERSLEDILEAEWTEEEINDRYKRQAITASPDLTSKESTSKESYIGFQRLALNIAKVTDINEDNCNKKAEEDLTMPGDVAHNVDVFFDEQGRHAVRIAKFISSYLQTVDPNEKFTGRKGDHILAEEELIGEVLATVVSDRKIWGAGVFWDLNAYPRSEGRPRFGPHAFPLGSTQDKKGTRSFKVVDLAGRYEMGMDYLDNNWFRNMKARWRTTVEDLQLETQKFDIRSSPAGTQKIRFEHYPQQYFSADYAEGTWTNPYFNCDGPIYHWLLSYVIPFFGPNILGKGTLEFKGVVKVDVRLKDLDINQCDMEAWVPNAFKNTHRCDRETTYCEHYPEQGFVKGNYMCLCKQGYEYPWEDIGRWYDGQQMELHYTKKLGGDRSSRYDRLKCRLAGAGGIESNVLLISALAIVSLLHNKFS